MRNLKEPLVKNKFDGLSYYTKTSISFNQGGRYFTFYISIKPLLFYLYLHFFRIWIGPKISKCGFTWLGF